MRRGVFLGAIGMFGGAGLALAQPMPGMDMGQAPSAQRVEKPLPVADGGRSAQPVHLHAAPAAPAPAVRVDTGMAGMAMDDMRGEAGAYAMTRDASGTAWQPDSSPMEGVHGKFGDWSTMLHGYGTAVYDDQGGPRGDTKVFAESMIMGMAQRGLYGGTLTLRAMGSLDPFMGKSGYPLLLATGETADGRTPLVDRQHPHDLFMELAAIYSHPISEQLSAFVYAGLPGEPALGPVTYMHRFSGLANPEAPIDHHWLDSTHITFGVVTAGVVYDNVKIETSSFKGREPDQYRYDIEPPRLDSWSVRASYNPSPDWSLQVSHGYLHSPEQLEPMVNQARTTASVTYNRGISWRALTGNWQSTLAWGRDENRPGRRTDAFLLESAASVGQHSVFGRVENVSKDELFADDPASPLDGQVFNVTKISVGYFYTVPLPGHLAADLGGLVSRYALPKALDDYYGSDPTSFMLFSRIKIGG